MNAGVKRHLLTRSGMTSFGPTQAGSSSTCAALDHLPTDFARHVLAMVLHSIPYRYTSHRAGTWPTRQRGRPVKDVATILFVYRDGRREQRLADPSMRCWPAPVEVREWNPAWMERRFEDQPRMAPTSTDVAFLSQKWVYPSDWSGPLESWWEWGLASGDRPVRVEYRFIEETHR